MKIGIVGLGQSGILLAYKLANRGLDLTLIDAGDFDCESTFINKKSYLFSTSSSMPDGVHKVGGGANLWYGRVSKFPDYVFDNACYGWPIEAKEMAHYYSEVYKILGFGNLVDSDIVNKYNPDLTKSLLPNLEISPYFHCNPDYYLELLENLKKLDNVKFILNLPIREIQTNNPEKVVIVDFNGDSLIFDKLVVASGAIQSTSLLLRSLPNLPAVSNQSLIGKGLMEHFDGYVGCLRIRKRDVQSISGIVDGSSAQKVRVGNKLVRYGFGLKLSKDFYKTVDKNFLDFHLHFEPYQEIYTFGELYFLIQNRGHIKRNLFSIELLWRKFFLIPLRKRFDSFFGFQRYLLYLKGEEFTNYDSQIYIGDSSSSALVTYNHQISKATTSVLRKSLKIFRANYHQERRGRIRFFWWFMHKPGSSSTGPNWHPMGTTPMHADKQKRVVNSDLSLTGYSSIFMLSASVFPSGSYQNPATTTLALSLRLADHITGKARDY